MATVAPAAFAAPAAPPPGVVAASPVVIKPIPPKGPGQDLGLHLHNSDDLGILKPRARDDQGRFAASGDPTAFQPQVAGVADDSGVVQEPQSTEPDPTLPTDEPPPATDVPVNLAGQQFRNQAHADQFVSTLMGQYRAMGEREQNAAKQAYAWMERAQQLEQRASSGIDANTGFPPDARAGATASLSSRGTPPSTTAPQPFTAADAERMLTDAVDMKIYQQILNKDGPGLAQVYLHQANQGALQSVLAKVLEAQEANVESHLAPFHEWAATMNTASTTHTLFDQATNAADEGGQPYFPELRDATARAGIAEVWLGMLDRGLPETFTMSPEGVHMAVSLYRDVVGYNKRRGNGNGHANTASVNDGGIGAQVAAAIASRASGNAVAPGARLQASPSNAPLPPHREAARRIMNAGLYDPVSGVRR